MFQEHLFGFSEELVTRERGMDNGLGTGRMLALVETCLVPGDLHDSLLWAMLSTVKLSSVRHHLSKIPPSVSPATLENKLVVLRIFGRHTETIFYPYQSPIEYDF